MIALKSSLSEYSENEFLELIKEICGTVGTEEYQDELLEHFIEATGNSAASDWIDYPEDGEDDSPKGILESVKAWRAAQGLPGFKVQEGLLRQLLAVAAFERLLGTDLFSHQGGEVLGSN